MTRNLRQSGIVVPELRFNCCCGSPKIIRLANLDQNATKVDRRSYL